MKSKMLFNTGTQDKNALVFVSASDMRVLLSFLSKGVSGSLTQALISECEARMKSIEKSWSKAQCLSWIDAHSTMLDEHSVLTTLMLPEYKQVLSDTLLCDTREAIASAKACVEALGV